MVSLAPPYALLKMSRTVPQAARADLQDALAREQALLLRDVGWRRRRAGRGGRRGGGGA